MQIKQGNKTLLAIGSGVLLGEMLTISGAFIFIVLLSALTAYFIYRTFSEKEERDFILKIFTAGLLIRALFCIALYLFYEFKGVFWDYYGYTANGIFGDSAFSSTNGLWLSQFWGGHLQPTDIDETFFKNLCTANPYIYGVFYYIFGFKELSAKFIDVILGAVSPVFIYLVTKQLFSKKAARIAFILTMFFPSLVLWSITNLKETKQVFLASAALYLSFNIFKRPFKPANLFFFLLSSALLYFMKIEYGVLFIVTMAVSFYFAIPAPLKKKIALLFALAFLTIAAFYYNHGFGAVSFLTNKIHAILAQLVYQQTSAFFGMGINYKIYDDALYSYIVRNHSLLDYNFTLLEPFIYIIRGSAHFLFVPFPWRVSSLGQLAVMPQMIAWYILFIFAVIGARFALIEKRWRSLVLILFIVLTTVLSGLVSGNVGTAFRHRDLITPFYLIFSSFGIVKLFFERNKKIE